jgi:short-subunit dehydrogenase
MNEAQSKPLAVVTGASSGIGFELAKVFAENGYDLMIAAEDAELAEAQRELEQIASVDSVDVLALNAGIGAGGDFARETPLDKELELIDRNVRSTVHLCKPVVADTVARGEGRILFTSSIKNKVQTVAGKIIPDSKKAEMHRQMAEPGSAEEARR